MQEELGSIGHGERIGYLRASFEKGRLAHAYLFVGPEHAGKMTVARTFAADLLGTDRLVTHPDFVTVERERDAKTGKLHGAIILDQIHALTGRLALGAFGAGYKICIINGAETMTTEAANALLKTLEEPKSKTVLLLLAASEADVLPTISSRCQVMRFGRVPAPDIAAALRARGVTSAKAALYAGLSGGLPGKAISYADDPSSLDDMYALRETLLSFPERTIAERFAALEKLIPAKTPFQEAGDKATAIAGLAAELVHDALLVSTGATAEARIHADAADRVAAWAASAGERRLADLGERIGETRGLIAANVNPRTALERLALSF